MCHLIEGAVGGFQIDVTTGNLDRLDLYVDGRPLETRDVSDGVQTFNLPPSDPATQGVELYGHDSDDLVAYRYLEI